MARNVSLGIAAARIGLGLGALLATGPALRALGFPDQPPARALGKLTGGRDLILGILPFLLRNDPPALRAAVSAAAAADALDAVVLGASALRDGELGRAGLVGALSGGGAALTGAWAACEIGPGA